MSPDTYEFRDRVISRALKVLSARLYMDLNPSSSAAPADLEYAEDEFDVYVRAYAEVLNRKDAQ